jgi:hypothetical protein
MDGTSKYSPVEPAIRTLNVNSPMLELVKQACDNIDWRFVKLSRRRYGNSRVFTVRGDPHWLERPFAYEIYHELRLLWAGQAVEPGFAIQGEVLKTYQAIRHIDHMPDLLFHKPNSSRNLMVAEVELASNTKTSLADDIEKLALFRRALEYRILLEIIIGTAGEIRGQVEEFNRMRPDCDIPINILAINTRTHASSFLRPIPPAPTQATARRAP